MNNEDKARHVNLWSIVRKLWPVLRVYRFRFSAGFAFIVLSTVIEVINPLLIGKTVDIAVTSPKNWLPLLHICFLFLGLITVRSICEAFEGYLIQSTGQRVTHDLRSLVFQKIESLPIGYFDKNPTGRLLTRVVNDIKSLSELFTASISVLALDFMIIVGTLVGMFWVDWKLASVALFSFPAVIFTIHHFGNRMAEAYRLVRTRLAEINSFLGENIGAVATIQRLAAEKERYATFSQIVEAHTEAQVESIRVFARVQPITNVINGIAMSGLILVGGYWVAKGQTSLGTIVAFFGYLRNLFQPVRDLVEKYNTFLSATVAAERIVGILDEKSESEIREVWAAPQALAISDLPVSSSGVRFENIEFRYPLRQANALDKVSFDIPGGTSLAVVGATGSGKSTLIRLLLRFYEPNSGEIYFGEKRLSDWDRFELRRKIGVIHQEIYLFQGTVRENLTLNRYEFSDRYLIEQCERAQLWPFIRHRGGLDMVIQEGGSNYSIGERQLISFARILVFDTPVLVLDEATSSMDRLLEKRLMAAVQETVAGRTSIIIAHRLSTIRQCQKVIVLEQGRLIEEGRYDQLVHQNGVFSKFHQIHSRS